MSVFSSRREKRRTVEAFDGVLMPLMPYLNDETKELIKNGMSVMRDAEVVEEADIEKWNRAADKIHMLLIDVGQHDPQFHLGEFIKYRPDEVADIIRDNAVKLEEL